MRETVSTPQTAPAVHPAFVQEQCAAVAERLLDVVALDRSVTEPILVALLARGHVLIEGVPGVGKTLLARTLSRCLDVEFRRIQFTNDLMPSDVVGATMWKARAEEFEFAPGPVFTNILLADEINRTSPRTLSCLLEVMEEAGVSVDGQSVPLPDPFLVLATRNPIEFHGTFPIPEAALDRFLVRVELDYPTASQEQALYLGRDPAAVLRTLEPVLCRDTLLQMMALVDSVEITEPIAAYCHAVVTATRGHEAVALGASPRAAMAWLRAARARALLEGRDYVVPDDLKSMARSVLAHRIFQQGGGDGAAVLEEVLAQTDVRL